MEQLRQSRLASILTVIVGVWVILSPIFISTTGGPLVSLLITGAVMIISGIAQLFWESSLPSWINMIAAAWLFVSAFGFTISSATAWNQVISAVIAFVFATWDGVEITEVQQIHRQQHLRHHAM